MFCKRPSLRHKRDTPFSLTPPPRWAGRVPLVLEGDWAIRNESLYRRYAIEIAELMSACGHLLWGQCVPGKGLRWIRRITDRFLRLLGHRGDASAFSSMKQYFAACRAQALGDPKGWGCWKAFQPPLPLVWSRRLHRLRLMQLSRAARALPAPPKELVREAVAASVTLAETTFHTDTVLLTSFHDFCRAKAAVGSRGIPKALSSAASFSNKRSSGGVGEESRVLVDDFRSAAASEGNVLSILEGIRPLLVASAEFLTHWSRYFNAGGVPYDCDITDLIRDIIVDALAGPHPGKVEAQNWSVDDDVFHGHSPFSVGGLDILRSGRSLRVDEVFFLWGQDRDLQSWEALREELFLTTALWGHLDFVSSPKVRLAGLPERGWKTRVIIAEECAMAHFSSILGSCLFNLLEQDPRLSSSKTGVVPWGGSRGAIVRSLDLKEASPRMPFDLCRCGVRGILEGLKAPQWLRKVAELSFGPRVLKHGKRNVVTNRGALIGNAATWPLLSFYVQWLIEMAAPGCWYLVTGDDLIASITRAQNRELDRLIECTGGEVSPGKDMVSPEHVGVFMEELYYPYRHRVDKTLSVRTLLGKHKGSSDSPLWQQGPSLSRCTLIRSDLLKFLHKHWSSSLAILRRLKIDPFLPRWAGGGGFPGLPSQRSLRFLRMLLSQERATVLKWTSGLEAAWLPSGSHSSFELAWEILESYKSEFLSSLDPDPNESIPVSECVSRLAGKFSSAFTLVQGLPSLKPVTAGVLVRRLSRITQEVLRKGFWVPREEVRSPEGLYSMVLSLEPRISNRSLGVLETSIPFHSD